MREGKEKLFSLQDLASLVEGEKKAGKTVVLTNGCFDLLHPGHLRYLREARSLGDCLIVALNSDASVRRLKGSGRPLFSEQDRAEMLAALEVVDYVVIFPEETPEAILTTLKPHLHVKGGDYAVEDLPESQVVREYGGKSKVLPFHPGYSTSGILQKIQEASTQRAVSPREGNHA